MIGIRCISTLKSNFYIDYLHCVLNHPFFSLPSRTVCAQLFLISFSAFLALASWVPVSGLVPLVVIPTLWPGWSRNTHICPSVPPLPSPEHSPDSPASMLYGYHPPLPACRALLLHWPRLPSSSTFRAVLISMPLPGLASVFETIFSAFRFLFILHILQDSKSALSFSCLLFSLQFLTLLFSCPIESCICCFGTDGCYPGILYLCLPLSACGHPEGRSCLFSSLPFFGVWHSIWPGG